MEKTLFGKTKSGEEAFLYTFENENMKMTVSDFGATLTNLWVEDKNGELEDVVLGFPSLKEYEENNEFFFGATVGRNANRVEKAQFRLNGMEYQLNRNEGENNLHSGPDGYHLRVWRVKRVNELENSITFALNSPDGDQGFPGKLTFELTYQLHEHALSITYEGYSDKETIFNPTNHSYFNLNGHQSGDVLDHSLQMDASKYTPLTDENSIPSGEVLPVENTPFDFRNRKRLGKDIQKDYRQLDYAQGYDHNMVVESEADVAVSLVGEQTGILLEISTDFPGIQFYTGNALDHTPGKAGAYYPARGGICFETQFFPNALNEPAFETPLLKKNKEKAYKTIYNFSVAD